MSAAERWGSILSAALAARDEDVLTAAKHFAYAVRPLPCGATVEQYWSSLGVLAQQAHVVRVTALARKSLGLR